MNPVAPIVSLPRPESDRILFDRIVVGMEYYVEYREYIGSGWGQRTMLLLAKVHPDTTSSMVVCWPVWSLGVGNWLQRVTYFSANRAQIDTDNGGMGYYHFYRTPQGPVGDPTAGAVPVALAPPVGAAAPAAAVGNNAAGDPVAVPAAPALAPPVGAAAPAAAVGNNAAGDPVAPRRLPSRKRKRSRRTNRSRRTPRFNRGNE